MASIATAVSGGGLTLITSTGLQVLGWVLLISPPILFALYLAWGRIRRRREGQGPGGSDEDAVRTRAREARSRRIEITIHPDGTVTVSVPP